MSINWSKMVIASKKNNNPYENFYMPFLSMFEKQVYINKSKKCVTYISKNGSEEIKKVVKCHPDDEFDWEIGLALAIERTCPKDEKFKYQLMRKLFTNKKNNLDYKKYAEWVTQDKFGFNFRRKDFLNNEYSIWKVKFVGEE